MNLWVAWPIPLSLLFKAKESLGACSIRVSVFSIRTQPWEVESRGHHSKEAFLGSLFCTTLFHLKSSPGLPVGPTQKLRRVWFEGKLSPSLQCPQMEPVTDFSQDIELTSKQMGKQPSSWEACYQSYLNDPVSLTILWFHNHSSSHELCILSCLITALQIWLAIPVVWVRIGWCLKTSMYQGWWCVLVIPISSSKKTWESET